MLNSWSVPSGNKLTPLFEAYMEITALRKFVEMNSEGFRKIVKKYDKTMGTDFLNRQEGRKKNRYPKKICLKRHTLEWNVFV